MPVPVALIVFSMLMDEPPAWAVELRYAMDAALPEIEIRCVEESDDEEF